MALPSITLNITNTLYGLPDTGELVYKYGPFMNLQNPVPNALQQPLIPLRLNAASAEIAIDKPLSLESEVSYDNSVNLIITDNVNPPKIVNSRFYQTDSTHFAIADRKGNLDTNIYSKDNFKIESGLIKSVRTITTVDFLGIKDGGRMSVGNYSFYFKLADADGNESDFIAESGKVVCHIGAINDPYSIRGGLLNEDSGKIIKFKLNNLDLAYDYINIYYSRSSGDGDSEITQTYVITDKFKITSKNTEISITGYENHQEIDISTINVKFANFESVKTLTNCQNISFAGNIANDYSLFKTLEKFSLYVTPEVIYDREGIGNLTEAYQERYKSNGYEYYNTKNIYYKLGYWDEEIYRFGIVYIMNDYTLSPVFNIRGKQIVNESTTYYTLPAIGSDINYGEDFIIEGQDGTENVKGVFKIDLTNNTENILSGLSSIKPIGFKFTFNNDINDNNVIDGTVAVEGLSKLTKGFFIVRQKRIPTILAQGVGIGTSSKAYIPVLKGYTRHGAVLNGEYFSESFLSTAVSSLNPNGKPILQRSLFSLKHPTTQYVNNNALLCPEASVRRKIFNSFFNSSQFTLKPAKYTPSSKIFVNTNGFFFNFTLSNFIKTINRNSMNASLTLVEPGISSIRNNNYEFSSKAGEEIVCYKHSDPVYGDYEDVANVSSSDADFNNTATKVRGVFNTYIGVDRNDIIHGEYYNIFEKDYDFTKNWKEYFKIRYNDSSSYFPVSDRIEWSKLTIGKDLETDAKLYYLSNVFRGDCYINTYTHRMNWNFIDSELPTNHRIVDPFTWYKHFKIVTKSSTTVDNLGVPSTTLSYKKLLPLYTYKNVYIPDHFDSAGNAVTEAKAVEGDVAGLLEPDAKKFKKYSEINGLFGFEKMNKPDINAVPLGHWVTIKVCSNVNLAMRDIDFSNPMEEAVHRKKRGFFPYHAMDPKDALPESDVINGGISKSHGNKYYYEVPDVPFIKTSFTNRIHYSNVLQQSSFTNGNRVFESKNYQDYTLEHGSLTKLVEWYGTLIAIMEHGVLMIPVNERAMMANAGGENVYINTDNVLPKNPKVLSNTFGSLWADSIVKTPRFIYGIDTVGKKIWRTNGQSFELISDLKIQKFLNDKIQLKESERDMSVGKNFIKSHYNAFKQDIIFTFNYEEMSWSLCWNELTNKWITQYTWFPEFSENINNIFYTFANRSKHENKDGILYKHGFAGNEEELGNILPTNWYDEQHPFEFEFVVIGVQGVQKIFNNLKIISNLAEPNSFFFEVVGEGFDWHPDKSKIYGLENQTQFTTYLGNNPEVKKLPYIITQSFDINDPTSFYRDRGPLPNPFNMSILRDLTIREHNKTKEKLVNIYQKGADIKKYGRVKGNMQYLEDAWDVQIQPIIFNYAYLKNGYFTLTNVNEMKIRDKYIKIRVKYDGTQYAIINALKTFFTISYA